MKTEISKLELRKVNGLPSMNKFNQSSFWLSQSTMKGHKQWANGQLCGIVYRELYLNNNLNSITGDAARLGQYFEFMATGSMPAYGDAVPEPERYSRSGSATNYTYEKGDLKPEWRHAQLQANNFAIYCKELGFTIIQAALRVKRSDKQGNPLAGGNLDIIIQVSKENWEKIVATYHEDNWGKLSEAINVKAPKWEDCKFVDAQGIEHQGCIIIDLKYSGLLYDKWHEAGWDLERLQERDDTIIQAKHYHWLSGGLPFFFWVFDSKDEDNRLIRIFFDDNVIEDHVELVTKFRDVILSSMALDSENVPAFKEQPILKDCNVCPLRSNCKFRAKSPVVFGVHVQSSASAKSFF